MKKQSLTKESQPFIDLWFDQNYYKHFFGICRTSQKYSQDVQIIDKHRVENYTYK